MTGKYIADVQFNHDARLFAKVAMAQEVCPCARQAEINPKDEE
jgi:hypothetical protein